MTNHILKIGVFFFIAVLVACAHSTLESDEKSVANTAPPSKLQAETIQGSPFGPVGEFIGSPHEEIERSGLFGVHPPDTCRIAVLPNGDDSFVARVQALRNADTSIRIQALVFTGDESGIYITELLKEKKAQGLDVRIIVDGLSNPVVQTQWMYFDLKQHGIEVEGYETFYMQWLNEIPFTTHNAADGATNPNKRFHEKMWIIDGETDHGVAITGGLNIANEYFRIDPQDPQNYWRDQDVIVEGAVIKDMVTTFDRNFAYFIEIKESRGIFNTNIYWDATRHMLDKTGKVQMQHNINKRRDRIVHELADKELDLTYENARCRFFQNRPRFKETYIEQAYLKAIKQAEREILIGNAYFIASSAFVDVVKEAARRCVKVVILTNSPVTNDLPMLTMVGREYYDDILSVNDDPGAQSCVDGGIQMWEWQGRRSGSEEQTEGTLHAKYAVFDRRLAFVGSYNMDPRSRNLNAETLIVFENETLAGQLADFFIENDLNFSERITMQDAKEFTDSTDAFYQFQKKFGLIFEDAL